MDKQDAMFRLFEWVIFREHISRRPEFNRPGAVVERMNEETRAALRELKSSDLANPMKDHLCAYIWDREEEMVKRYKREFDLKLMRARKMHNPYASNVFFMRP